MNEPKSPAKNNSSVNVQNVVVTTIVATATATVTLVALGGVGEMLKRSAKKFGRNHKKVETHEE
jgi:hypothetical protein